MRAFLNQRGDDWREGVAAAFVHFGGVPLEVLGDNARPLVDEHDRQAGTVRFHPAWVEFCKDWVRAPDHVEHRFRGKWNTDSGASGTPIPAMWNTDSGQVERTLEVGGGIGNPVER
ncbi:transposase [Cystobacter ferrugineus]|uniref:transposase n=1 Tax=Cystobacter ferrugineus TaxID=83449 RepID=UPI000A8B845F|nr:transposase [Cystobacter ferrugineus]